MEMSLLKGALHRLLYMLQFGTSPERRSTEEGGGPASEGTDHLTQIHKVLGMFWY